MMNDHGNNYWQMTTELASTVNFDGYVIGVNSQYEKKLHYLPNEMVGRHFLEFIDSSDRELAEEAFEMIIQGKDVKGFEIRHKGKDGQVIWMRVGSTKDEKNKCIYFVGEDISKEKELAKQIKYADNVIWSSLNDLPIGIAIYLAKEGSLQNLEIEYVNTEYSNITGYSKNELLGTNRRDLQLIEDIDSLKRLYEEFEKSDSVQNFKTNITCKNKSQKDVLISVQRIYSRKKTYWISSILNITQYVSIENELKKNQLKLQASEGTVNRQCIAIEEISETLVSRKNATLEQLKNRIRTNLTKVIDNAKRTDDSNEEIIRMLNNIISSIDQPAIAPSQDISLFNKLSSQEIKLAQLIKQGYSTESIREKMGIEVRTINSYRKSIRKKLGLVNSSVNLTTYLANNDF